MTNRRRRRDRSGHAHMKAMEAGAGTPPSGVRPGVGAVVLDQSRRVLLHRRRATGGWAPPSGTVEPGESLSRALHRELLEETSLRIRIRQVVGVYSEPDEQLVRYSDGRVIHFVTTVFLCDPVDGVLRGSSEGVEWAWYRPEELPVGLLPYGRRWLRDALNADAPFILR